MTQLSRLLAILNLLKSKRITTGIEFAENFDVKKQTVYKDIKKLQTYGVPVIAVGKRGFVLKKDYPVATVQFTEKQADALITGHHLIEQIHDSLFMKNFEEAIIKIKSVIKISIKDNSGLLDNNIHIFDSNTNPISSEVLSDLQSAITNLNYVEISSRNEKDNKISYKIIEPCAIYSTNNEWILIAWCNLEQDLRDFKDLKTFKIDKIQYYKILNKKFEDPKFSIKDYFASISYNKM